jgi:hypothetical protein
VLNDKRHILVRENWKFLFQKNFHFFFLFHICYLDCFLSFFIYYFYVFEVINIVQGVWEVLHNASDSVYQFETQ